MIALLFPGQGSQAVGMGAELADACPAARHAFEEADDVLGYGLSRIAFEGPQERLTATEICQPALVATSVATWRAAEAEGLCADLALGHSLGEYSALVAAGAMAYADALRVVAERGAAMAEAGRRAPGGMLALIGPSDEDAEALCARAGEAWPANFNCPGQVVASGTLAGLDRLEALAQAEGVRTSRLRVAGAFHSPLMAPAAERLRPALAAWTPAPSPEGAMFISTTTCRPEPPEALPDVLLAQLTSPVRFGASVGGALDRGATRFLELGPGRVLSGLVRRVDRGASVGQVATPEDLAAALASVPA